MRFRVVKVAPLLFFSGACALVYQVAWLRELRLVFGVSTSASAAVLGVFRGGRGRGGLVLGKRADREPNPLAFYARLEVLVALSAALTPSLVWIARSIYLALGGQATLGSFGATVARLVLGSLVLVVPTTLMGGTLPAAARAVASAEDRGRRSLSALYGVNTLGAVLGTLSANFVLLEVFGTRLTLWLVCLLNLLVAMVARMLSRIPDAKGSPGVAPTAEPAEKPAEPAEEPASIEVVEARDSTLPRSLAWFPSTAAAIVGFAFLLMELVWYRMLAPLLGGSSYTFGLILAVALFGMGLGGALYSLGRRPPTLRGFALTCGLEALFIAVPYALGDRIALLALALRPLRIFGLGGSILGWSVVAAVVVLPAAVVSGVQFPLIVGLYGKGDKSLGKHVGVAYLANTLGAIVGSLAGGFGLMPALTAPGCWRLVVALLAASGLVALFLSARHESRRGPIYALGLASAVLAFSALWSQGPTAAWRHSPIGAGRSDVLLSDPSPNGVEAWRRSAQGNIAWEADGLESSVALGRDMGYAFIVNGKVDGNAIGDAPTQIMGGLLGAILHPNPRRTMVIGLGTGSTAGWLGQISTMERVDVIELEPAILRVARDCSPVNQDVLHNPKVHIVLGDAREVLITSRERYDVIFSEPSNPYRAGISSLFTREYYEAARRSLADGGFFVQWMQGYDVDAGALHTVLSTLQTVFADVAVWESMPTDFFMVARRETPSLVDLPRLRERLTQEPFRSATRDVWGGDTAENLLSHFVAGPELAEAILVDKLAPVNSDDRNVLEFAYARSVGSGAAISEELTRVSRALKVNRPRVVGGVVDWNRVDDLWFLDRILSGPLGLPPPGHLSGPRAAYFRMLAAQRDDDSVAFVGAWKSAGVAQPIARERVLLARHSARLQRSPETEAALADLEKLSPGTFEAVVGERALAQRSFDEAAAHFVKAFEGARTDPWIDGVALSSAIKGARACAEHQSGTAPRLEEALRQPFVLRRGDLERRRARLALGAMLPGKACVPAFSEEEPSFPWSLSLLRLRLACYERAQDPRASTAAADVRTFMRGSPPRVAGLE